MFGPAGAVLLRNNDGTCLRGNSQQQPVSAKRNVNVLTAYKAVLTAYNAWNEYGEGGIMAPTQGDGYMKLETIAKVFGTGASDLAYITQPA